MFDAMNQHIAHSLESKISDLYATECWLTTLEDAFMNADSTNPHFLSWIHFLQSSWGRREMLRFMANLEGCRITFEWIRPRARLEYDYAGLAEQMTGAPASGAETAEALDRLTHYLALQYIDLLNFAQEHEVYSLVLAVDAILETMPQEYQRFLHDTLERTA